MNFLRRLQFRILAALAVVAVIPIALISVFNFTTARQVVVEEVQARQLEVTKIIHDQVSQFITEIVGKLETLGRGSLVLDLERESLNRYIASYLEEDANGRSIYRSIWLMDAEGNELAGILNGSPIPLANLNNRREEEIFFRPERGETFFSNVRLIGSSPQISLSVPITDETGQFVGVVAAVIELQETWTVIQDLELGASGYAMLLDRRGNIMVHRLSSFVDAGFNLATAPAYAAAIRGANLEMYEYESQIGGDVISSALPIEGPDWVLMVERPTNEAYATIEQALSNIYWGLVVALVVALGISFFLANQIARPIIGLRDVVQRFGSGAFGVRSPLQSDDEIGQLAEGFNTMADRLQNRIDEIDQKNQALQEANQKVVEASRMKDDFLAVMSHELRTPLNAIIGFSGILLMDEELSDKQTFQVQRIETNSERLLNLINDILDISRIQAGRMSFNPVPVDIRRICQRIHEQLEVLAKTKSLQFSQNVAEDVPKIISIDEDALIKILTNLSSNAIKFTNHGSVSIDVSREANHLLIRVTDTGIGIPPQMQEVIFEEFRQVDSSSMRSYGGTGLGLAIVRRLAVALGGGVSVKSKINEGSVFTVTLPLLGEAEKALIGDADVQSE